MNTETNSSTLQQRTYHMDLKSTAFLKEYEQLLTSTFKTDLRTKFSFEMILPPPVSDVEDLDVVVCTIKDMRLTAPKNGGPGKELTILFNAFLEAGNVRVDMRDLIYGSLFEATRSAIQYDTLNYSPNMNEFVLGRFEKGLSISAIAAFSTLKEEIVGDGFYLEREGYVPPPDEEDEDD